MRKLNLGFVAAFAVLSLSVGVAEVTSASVAARSRETVSERLSDAGHVEREFSPAARNEPGGHEDHHASQLA